MKRLVFGFVKSHPWMVLLALLASLGSSAAFFLLAVVLDFAVSAFVDGWDWLAFSLLIGYVLLFFLLYWAYRAMEPYLQAKAGDYVRTQYLAYLLQPNRLTNGNIGHELNDVLDNSGKAVNAYLLKPINLVSEVLGLAAAAIYGGLIHYGLTLIGLGIGGLQLLSTSLFQSQLGKMGQKYNQADADLRDESERLLSSKGELQANRATDFAQKRFLSQASQAKAVALAYHRRAVSRSVVSTLLSTLGELLCLALVGYLVLRGQADLGTLAAAILILPLISDPVTDIASDLATVFASGKIPVMKVDLSVGDEAERPLREFQGVEVKINRQDGSGLRLTADFSLKPQEKALVLGDSGAGKTTLLRFLSGELEPKEGEIDFHNGTPASLSYCPQFPYCFKGSVKENIAFDDGDRGKLNAVSKQLGVKEDIVDPRQASGGEKKLIGLARSFYPQSGLLLLDEPASSLGKAEEARIYEAILAYPGALICTANKPRKEVAARFDRIYVVSEGKMVLADVGRYAHYCAD